MRDNRRAILASREAPYAKTGFTIDMTGQAPRGGLPWETTA